MIKKLIIISVIFVLAFFLIDRLPTFIESVGDSDLSTLNQIADFLDAILPILGIHLFFGVIARYVASSRGYNDGFLWGALLGLIGLLVTGFRPAIPKQEISRTKPAETLAGDLLASLKILHEQGILTDEEFFQKKEDILSRL